MRFNLFINTQLARITVCAAAFLVMCATQAQSQSIFAAIAMYLTSRSPTDTRCTGSGIRAVDQSHQQRLLHRLHRPHRRHQAGNTLCEDNVYANNFVYFNFVPNPVIFTPGDNEWTDCHRANNGSIDPLERLGLIRTLFFDGNKSLGQNPIPLFKDRPPYVENSIWRQRPPYS
jgi:hypothetical protein